jgi:hypothetical protein
MQRHLQEPRAANGVLDDAPEAARWDRVSGRKVVDIQRRILEERVEPYVVVRRVKAGVVEEVECLCVPPEFESFRRTEFLEDRKIESRLERRTEDVAPPGSSPEYGENMNGSKIGNNNVMNPL